MDLNTLRFGCACACLVALPISGCGPGGRRSCASASDGGNATAESTFAADAADPAKAPDPFEIPIERSVTVGAFIVDLDAATVVTEDSGDDAHTVTIPFRALNRATGARLPFGDLDAYDEILLEAGGAFFYGSADAALVPGGREGEGSLHWWVDGVPASDIVNARLIFGGGAVNEAVVDFADPDADEPLADIPIDATLVIEHYRHTTLEFEEVRVQYNSRSANRPLRSGTAELVMKGIIRADADMPFAGESWQRSNVFLLRPDGTSVSPGRLLTNLHPGDRERVTLVFELERPVAGTYTFGVTASDHEPEAHELSLP